MSKFSVTVLNLDGEDAPALTSVREAAENVGMSFADVTGSYDEVLAQVSDWAILPEVVVIQAPEGKDPEAAIEEIAARFPAGEAEVVLFNVPNDIRVYRALKMRGVREVFSGIPTREEMAETLEYIQTEQRRRTGIDPRRAVYVWSACGGAGGTSVAMAFARRFAAEGRRTLYLDLDLSTGPGSFMFNAEKGARETTGLMDVLANPKRIDALFLERAIDKAAGLDNLFYLSARRRTNDPNPQPAAVPIIISRAQQNFDMVVIDVPWRANPEPEMGEVLGPSYIVAANSPAGLLGFSVLNKELAGTPGKSPVFTIMNRAGEFKGNGIDRSVFKDAATKGHFFEIPYDGQNAGLMFFEQKSLDALSGKVKKSMDQIFATLPTQTADGAERAAAKAAAGKGGFSLSGLFKK